MMSKLKLHLNLSGCAVGYSAASPSEIMSTADAVREADSDHRITLTDETGTRVVADVRLKTIVGVSTLNVA